MHGTPPPASRWPLMLGARKERNLVEPTKAAMGFPSGVPGIPNSIFQPENFVFPVLDYDWGPEYDHSEASGVPTNAPPPILHVIKMMVPRVDADGNEMGGVPTVHPETGQPDPRPSLEERYVTHAGYVAAVRAAADNAACQGYLLAGPEAAAMGAKCTTAIPAGFPDDWAVLVNAAMASNVCNQPADGGKCNPGP